MSQRSVEVNETVQVILTLNVTLKSFSNHNGLNESEKQNAISEFKEKIEQHLKNELIYNAESDSRMEFLQSADRVHFEVAECEDFLTFDDAYYTKTLKSIEQLQQTQTSLNNQLRILRPFANKLGLYDAADYIKIN